MNRNAALSAIMRRFSGMAAMLAVIGAGLLPARAAPPPTPASAEGVWFDKLGLPPVLTDPQGIRLALELRPLVARGKADEKESLAFLPADLAPRIVILSFGDGATPPVTVTGTGEGLRAALTDALKKAWKNPAHTRAARLKIDLVQHAVLNPAFRVRQDPLPQPSLAGLAFHPSADLVILPEAVVANAWTTPDRILRGSQVADAFVGEKTPIPLLTLRQQLLSSTHPAQVCFFECQTYFTDGGVTGALFRGHRLGNLVSAASLKTAGNQLRGFLFSVQERNGGFACRLPGWIPSGENGAESASATALTLAALMEWQSMSPDDKTLPAVERGIRRLLAQMKADATTPEAQSVVETSDSALPSSRLDTNALLTLAICRYRELTGKQDWSDELNRLGRHLLARQQPDGSFVSVREHPSGKLAAPESDTASAQACLALVNLHARTGNMDYLQAANRGLAYLCERAAQRPGRDLPEAAWLVTALNDYFTYDRNKAFAESAARFGAAILGGQTADPVFPDFAGGWNNSPGLADAAVNTLGLLSASRFCRDTRREKLADLTLDGAHLGLIFLLQGQGDDALLFHHPQAKAYAGAFRTSLTMRETGLETQGRVLFALAAGMREAMKQPNGALPATDAVKNGLATMRTETAKFPRSLPLRLPSAAAADGESAAAGVAAPPDVRPGIPVPKKK